MLILFVTHFIKYWLDFTFYFTANLVRPLRFISKIISWRNNFFEARRNLMRRLNRFLVSVFFNVFGLICLRNFISVCPFHWNCWFIAHTMVKYTFSLYLRFRYWLLFPNVGKTRNAWLRFSPWSPRILDQVWKLVFLVDCSYNSSIHWSNSFAS